MEYTYSDLILKYKNYRQMYLKLNQNTLLSKLYYNKLMKIREQMKEFEIVVGNMRIKEVSRELPSWAIRKKSFMGCLFGNYYR